MSDSNWFCMIIAAVGFAAMSPGAEPPDEPAKDVELTGTLETGIVAVGGETTGIVVRTENGAVEIDVGEDLALKQACEKLNRQKVRVAGKLRVVAGIEVAQRRILRLAKITPLK